MSRRSLCFLVILSLSSVMAAQEMRLSNRFVIDVAVDAQDRIWVATEEGLNCYDGITMRTFLKSPEGLPANSLNGVLPDRDDPLLWVATQKGGLACLDLRTESFSVYSADGQEDSLPDDDISHIEQAPDGTVWVSTFSKGMARLDKSSGRFERFTSETFEGMRDVPLHTFKFRGDQMILGFWAGGVSILSLSDHSRIDLRHDPSDPGSLPSDSVRALLVDSQGRIWVGTMDGLALYSGAGRSFTVYKHLDSDPHSLPDDAVYDLAEDASGNLLVATGGGVARVDIHTGSFDPGAASFDLLTRPGRMDRSEVRAISTDRFGNLWVGTYGEGLYFRNGKNVGAGKLQDVPPGPGSREVQSLTVDEQDRLVAGFHSGQVGMEGGEIVTIPSGVHASGPVMSLLRDRGGAWWVGDGTGGLTCVTGRRKVNITLPGNPQQVRVLLEDGPLLHVGTDKGLYSVDRSSCKVLSHRTYSGGQLPDDLIRALLLDSSGRLWVGTYGHGLSVYDPDGTLLVHFDGNSGLPADTVNHFYQDSQGRIWVATTDGLVRIASSPHVIPATVSLSDGLQGNNVRAVTEDDAGNLWMSTNDGVACLFPDGKTTLFDRRDALPDGNYFNGAVARSARGRIWFGTTDGIAWIDPSVLLSAPEPPQVAFLTPASGFSTDYRHNNLHVRFRVPDHAFAGSVEYAYRIPDLDPAWHSCGPELEFHQLPYGRHTLQVRSRLHSRDWKDDFVSRDLVIRPPFWLTWWAKGFYILLFLSALAYALTRQGRRMARRSRLKLHQERLLQERQASEERLVFYTNVTHELRTPLTLILGPLADLAEDKEIPAKARSRIGKVKQSAQQLLGLVNQLLEFRKTETNNRRLAVEYGDLSAFVDSIGSQFRDLSIDKSVSVILAIEPGIRLWYDAELLTIILNNLLSNARKFTPSGRIVLSLQQKEDRVELSVSDTGVGIAADDLEHIFDRYYRADGSGEAIGTGIGLALVKNLCDLHRIGLDVKSEPGKGTEFRLSLNPAEEYPEARRVGLMPEEEEEEEEPAQEVLLKDETGKSRILIVEDNDEIRDYIRESLSPEFTVLQAEHGRDGLKIAIREIPDIIVSDIMMPVMDGITFCKAIRQDVRTSHIPVILLTAKGSDESRVEGYNVGADSYLVKPFRKSLLQSRICNLLDMRQRLMKQVSESGTAADLSPVDNEFLANYTKFVEEHLADEKIDIVSLAGQFAMSQSTLYRKVKAVSGLSPNELIRNIRLNRAAVLLKTTQAPVSEISWQTGFGSPVYFRTCFKERYGVTPSEYRESK